VTARERLYLEVCATRREHARQRETGTKMNRRGRRVDDERF